MLYKDGPQGVFSSNASSLTMLTLLALGTFTAGVQARVWRTCAVGAILFLAVPGDQLARSIRRASGGGHAGDYRRRRPGLVG